MGWPPEQFDRPVAVASDTAAPDGEPVKHGYGSSPPPLGGSVRLDGCPTQAPERVDQET